MFPSFADVYKYLNSHGFKQSHQLIDVRLYVGFMACAIAALNFYYDYKLGFEKTKACTLYAVIAYFTLNSILTWWIWWIEGRKVYVGQTPEGIEVAISSQTEKYSIVYHTRAAIKFPGGAQTRIVEGKNNLSGWFDVRGFLLLQPLHVFLQNSIPILPIDIRRETGRKIQ